MEIVFYSRYSPQYAIIASMSNVGEIHCVVYTEFIAHFECPPVASGTMRCDVVVNSQ